MRKKRKVLLLLEAEQKKTIRFDYFETLLEINGENYIAKFDVEVFPGTNNYRTHKINKINLAATSATDTGPVPAATDELPGSSNNNIPQNEDIVYSVFLRKKAQSVL